MMTLQVPAPVDFPRSTGNSATNSPALRQRDLLSSGRRDFGVRSFLDRPQNPRHGSPSLSRSSPRSYFLLLTRCRKAPDGPRSDWQAGIWKRRDLRSIAAITTHSHRLLLLQQTGLPRRLHLCLNLLYGDSQCRHASRISNAGSR